MLTLLVFTADLEGRCRASFHTEDTGIQGTMSCPSSVATKWTGGGNLDTSPHPPDTTTVFPYTSVLLNEVPLNKVLR